MIQGKEALDLFCERRTHYIMDRYMEFLNISTDDTGLLRELLTFRENYASLSDEEGPYVSSILFSASSAVLLK